MLKHDLGKAVRRNKGGTWTTTSNLPHEIRLHVQAGLELVRISAGIVVDTKPTKRLLAEINQLNTSRAFSRRIVVDDKVLIVAEMPVASLREGDLENLVSIVLCCARLDAPILVAHGGRAVTNPPPALAADMTRTLHSWWDVLSASGTATSREFAVWIDDLVGCDCWIDRDDETVIVAIGTTGRGSTYPCTLEEVRQSAADLMNQADEEDDEEERDDETPYNQAPSKRAGARYAG